MLRTQFLLLSCFMISIPAISFSQEDTISKAIKPHPLRQRHTISISYGTITPDYLLDGYRPGRPTEFDYSNKANPGALCIAYKYRFSSRAYIGVTATVEQQYGDWLDNEIPGGNVFDLQTTVKGAFVRTDYTIAADFTYDYAVARMCRAYAVAGIGTTYVQETDQYDPGFYNQGYYNGVNTYGPMRANNNRTHLTGYFSPLGIKVGRKLRYFFELGFGYRGVVNTGLSYSFNSKPQQK